MEINNNDSLYLQSEDKCDSRSIDKRMQCENSQLVAAASRHLNLAQDMPHSVILTTTMTSIDSSSDEALTHAIMMTEQGRIEGEIPQATDESVIDNGRNSIAITAEAAASDSEELVAAVAEGDHHHQQQQTNIDAMTPSSNDNDDEGESQMMIN